MKKAFPLFEILLVVFMVAVIVVVVHTVNKGLRTDSDRVKPSAASAVGTARLSTVLHDGHKWIVVTTPLSDGGVAIIHHPDCPAIHNNDAK